MSACLFQVYCFLCILSQYYEYRRLSRLEKKARVRRRRIEKLRSALNAEHGFDLESGEEYEESDYDVSDEDDMDLEGLDSGDPEAEEERMLRQRLRNIRRNKKVSLQGVHSIHFDPLRAGVGSGVLPVSV